MATVALSAPTTKSQALTTAYLASDFEATGAKWVDIWLDDRAIGFTVQIQIAGGDKITKAYDADEICHINTNLGHRVLINIKAASGSPNAQIEVH